MSLFGSKETKKSYNIPSYLEEGSKLAVQKATDISNRQYTPYTNQRVAGLSEGETQARNLALSDNRDNKAGQYLDQAGAVINSQDEFSGQNLSKYMNPYTDQVVGNTLRNEKQAYESEKANLGAGAATRGAFGSDRQALLESGLKQKHLQTVGDISASGYKDAFDKASELWKSDNQRKLQTADSLRAVGGDVQKLNSQQISDLVATGQTDRLLSQANMDFDYQQFVENRDWDVTNLQPLVSTLSSVPHSSSTTTKSSGGPLGTILGAIGTVAGAYFGFISGGPGGAVAGASAGGSLGKSLGGG